MTASDALHHVIRPTLEILGPPFTSREADCMLLAIGLKESGFRVRKQRGGGPAHGFWQFEPIAIRDFLQRGTPRIQTAVRELGFPLTNTALYGALLTPGGDSCACLLARDLLWRLPLPLPAIGDEEASWAQYLRQWRPGKPSRTRWAHVYPEAVRCVEASSTLNKRP